MMLPEVLASTGRAVLDVDQRLPAAFEERQLRLVFPFLQIANAAPADHTALLVQHNGVGNQVVLVFEALGFHELADARPVAHGLILERALAALVTDGAIQRVIQQDKGQVGLLHILHLLRVGLDHHVLGHRHRAGGLQRHAAGTGDLHQAHAAASHRVQLGMAAEDRDFDAQGGGSIHHQRALGHGTWRSSMVR